MSFLLLFIHILMQRLTLCITLFKAVPDDDDDALIEELRQRRKQRNESARSRRRQAQTPVTPKVNTTQSVLTHKSKHISHTLA